MNENSIIGNTFNVKGEQVAKAEIFLKQGLVAKECSLQVTLASSSFLPSWVSPTFPSSCCWFNSDTVSGTNPSSEVPIQTGLSLSCKYSSVEDMNYFSIVAITNYHGLKIRTIYFLTFLKVRSLRLKCLQGWFWCRFLSLEGKWLSSTRTSGYLCWDFS